VLHGYDGDPVSPIRGTAPNFWPMSIVAKLSPISATAEHLFPFVLKDSVWEISAQVIYRLNDIPAIKPTVSKHRKELKAQTQTGWIFWKCHQKEVIFWDNVILNKIMFSHVLHSKASRTDAFLKHADKWGFCKDIVTLNELLIKSNSSLFQKMQSPVHCLNSLFPSKKTEDYQLRNRQCQYVLPQCNFNVFKHSFVNWCLFTL